MGPLVTQLFGLISLTVALDNGLLKTPPMGWMAWERFRCDTDCKDDPENCISEALFRDTADRLAEDGWKELGYEYVIIDDCWMSLLRDEHGRLQPDPSRFPGGIAKLARYIHDRGLKLGIYADMGTHTCMGFPGTTLDKIEIDAQTFASWGVDYLKFDGCSSNPVEQMLGYPLMSKALNATGRPMAYSCSWPVYIGGLPPNVNYSFLGDICHLWRNYYDIQDSWDSVQGIIEWFSNNQDDLQPAAGPGRWNDPDMLIIGNFGLSVDQARSQMALWTIMAAPLIMSNDLRNLDNSARAILQNKVAIAINQDSMGIQGRRLLQENHIEVYWRPLSHSASVLVFLSRRTDMPYLYHTSLAKLEYDAGNYEAYDVFTGSTVTELNATTELTFSINPSGVVMWYVYPEQQSKQTETLHNQHNKASQFAFHKAKPVHLTVL
ncbi:alpha-N-acetylgalactosaminidase-like [Anarhichas minor]|uniref:alpha-N-acetylgalactosaminidase-like n=1 Tax=Anarhichas minor TaxID=65739 RepID=UPI003F73ED2C